MIYPKMIKSYTDMYMRSYVCRGYVGAVCYFIEGSGVGKGLIGKKSEE